MTLVASIGIARMVETNLVSVPKGVIEARKQWAPRQLNCFEILVPEALAPLILGVTFMTVGLIEFSAVAGLVGGGGLGDLAMTYGYQRFDTSVMFVTVVLLIILVQIAQNLETTLRKSCYADRKRKRKMKKILAFALSAIVGVSACSSGTRVQERKKK